MPHYDIEVKPKSETNPTTPYTVATVCSRLRIQERERATRQTPFSVVSISRNGEIIGGDKLLLAGEEYTAPAGGGLFFHPGDTPIGISVTPESAPVVFTVTEE